MQLSIRTKLVISFLIIVLFPLIGTGLYGNWTTSRTLETQALENARADLRLRARQIETYLGGVREDLLFLSRLDSLTAILADQPTPSLTVNLQSDFAAFAATHPDVFQARYLDAAGMEVARVDSTPDGLVIVPSHLLQNKADRYYFSAAMPLAAGEVYISPVDLNREFGAIQTPHIPTIRYATPVFHPDGSRVGIIILNLYAEPFLRFSRADMESDALLALADHSGWYLTHPAPTREWGGPNDLDTGAGAAGDYPLMWPVIAGGGSGVYAPPPQNWWAAFVEAVLPVGLFNSADSESRRVLVYETVWASTGSGPHWHLLRDEPRVYFFAAIGIFRLTAISILAVAAFTALIMAVSLARGLAYPIVSLTHEVRKFVLTRLGAARHDQEVSRAEVSSHDEIQELTRAFQEMSTAIDSHLEQLTQLNKAGRHIAARLERPAVLEAACFAAEKLLPVEYLSISLGKDVIHTCGDPAWAVHRETTMVTSVLDAALQGADWRTTGLSSQEGPAGFLCCAPICVDGELGLIEIYGTDPVLGKPSSGDLLATLAAQVSISLDNADLYARLERRKSELQTLVKQLITAQEEERRMVAFDIHDGLIQMLVGARLQLRNFVGDRKHAPAKAEAALQKGLDELGAAIVEARQVIEGLRPAMLDDLGLVVTLREMAEETRDRCQCELEFLIEPPNLRVPSMIEITAFRIAQEALTNVRKYSRTPRLRIALRLDQDHLAIDIQDWGQGFDPARLAATPSAEARGMGLVGMQERARLVGGECIIESQPGRGTRVRAILPLEPQESSNG